MMMSPTLPPNKLLTLGDEALVPLEPHYIQSTRKKEKNHACQCRQPCPIKLMTLGHAAPLSPFHSPSSCIQRPHSGLHGGQQVRWFSVL